MEEPIVSPAPQSTPPKEAGTIAIARTIFEYVEMFVLALCAVLIVLTFLVRHSPVEGDSMEPTLSEGDVLLMSGLGYTPERGDIIIAQSASYGLARPLVKRVIAVGGDELDIDFDTWEVRVNGELIDEPYLLQGSGRMTRYYSTEHLTFPMTLPEGYLFVMGDNRQNSADSRHRSIGLIDQRYVVGRVWSRVLPLERADIFS